MRVFTNYRQVYDDSANIEQKTKHLTFKQGQTILTIDKHLDHISTRQLRRHTSQPITTAKQSRTQLKNKYAVSKTKRADFATAPKTISVILKVSLPT